MVTSPHEKVIRWRDSVKVSNGEIFIRDTITFLGSDGKQKTGTVVNIFDLSERDGASVSQITTAIDVFVDRIGLVNLRGDQLAAARKVYGVYLPKINRRRMNY